MGNNNKGSMILLTIISVATLLVAVIGATFAYFNISVNNKDSETTIEVTNGTISIEYKDNSVVEFGAAEPGALVATKTFTINGLITGSSNLNYEVDLNVSDNTYADNQLVYTITSSNDSNNGTIIPNNDDRTNIPTGSNKIVVGKGLFAGPIPTGAVHTYTINIYVAEGAEVSPEARFAAKVNVYQATK